MKTLFIVALVVLGLAGVMADLPIHCIRTQVCSFAPPDPSVLPPRG